MAPLSETPQTGGEGGLGRWDWSTGTSPVSLAGRRGSTHGLGRRARGSWVWNFHSGLWSARASPWAESTRFQSDGRDQTDQPVSRSFYRFTHLYVIGGEGRLGNHWQEDESDPVGRGHTHTKHVTLQRFGCLATGWPVSAIRNYPPFTVPQHNRQQDEGQCSWGVQQQGPPRRGHADLRGVWKEAFCSLPRLSPSLSRGPFTWLGCAVVGSPQHRLAPVAPEQGLSAAVAQSAADLQLIEGAGRGQVDAEAPGADDGALRRRTPVRKDQDAGPVWKASLLRLTSHSLPLIL